MKASCGWYWKFKTDQRFTFTETELYPVDEFFVAGYTGSFQCDHFGVSQWRQIRQYDVSVSVFAVVVSCEIYWYTGTRNIENVHHNTALPIDKDTPLTEPGKMRILTQDLHSQSDRTFYHKISQSLEAMRLLVEIIVSIWNLTDVTAVLLSRCLPKY